MTILSNKWPSARTDAASPPAAGTGRPGCGTPPRAKSCSPWRAICRHQFAGIQSRWRTPGHGRRRLRASMSRGCWTIRRSSGICARGSRWSSCRLTQTPWSPSHSVRTEDAWPPAAPTILCASAKPFPGERRIISPGVCPGATASGSFQTTLLAGKTAVTRLGAPPRRIASPLRASPGNLDVR